MRRRTKLPLFLLFLCIFFPSVTSLSQTQAEKERLQKNYIPPEQIVSMSFATPFDRAVAIFNELSKKFLGKLVIDPEKRITPIGVDIESMHWKDAFERILRYNNLWYEETADYFRVVSMVKGAEAKAIEKEEKPTLSDREVQISAVFYSVDAAKVRESGINWSIFRGNNVNVQINQNAADQVQSNMFEVSADPRFKFDMDIHALLKLFDSRSLGEVIARPQITVRSGKEGEINVGDQFPVNTKDFAGNIITQLMNAGTIVKVTPTVITENAKIFVHLKVNVERSSVTTSTLGFDKAITTASTDALLLDGEETVIGGLYTNEEREIREGIPILKDLPWWFLGLRYVFGHNQSSLTRKDLIILIKAELLPPLTERIVTKENLIEKQRRDNESDTKLRQSEFKDKK
ncbi:MAG: type II and III secretion system protein [Bacteroidota bacterium]